MGHSNVRPICHNHLFIECTICNQEFLESNVQKCTYCNFMHCVNCINKKSAPCFLATSQCGECKQIKHVDCVQKKCTKCGVSVCNECFKNKKDWICQKCVNDQKMKCLSCHQYGLKRKMKQCHICFKSFCSLCIANNGCGHTCNICQYEMDNCEESFLDNCYVDKYYKNQRLLKMERRINGYEKQRNVSKYLLRKQA